MNSKDGTLVIKIAVKAKGLIAIGGVVYLAAKAGTKKALRQERSNEPALSTVVFNQANDAVKNVWEEVTDKIKDSTQGQYDTPDVDFKMPEQPKGTPGETP